MRFVDHQGAATEQYPFNPNGSAGGLTAVTTADGRFTAMMPHPERVFRNIQMSWTSGDRSALSPWMRICARAQVGGVRLQALVAWRRPLAFCLACTAPVGFAAEAQDAMLSRSFAHAKIQKITIERPAAQARFAPEVDCRGLVLDARRVKFFLQHAALTDSGSYRRNAILDDCSGGCHSGLFRMAGP